MKDGAVEDANQIAIRIIFIVRNAIKLSAIKIGFRRMTMRYLLVHCNVVTIFFTSCVEIAQFSASTPLNP